MSKEVINHVCSYCESPFKLSFDTDEVTSLPKFCPMCGNETLAELDEPEEQEIWLGQYEDDEPEL